jgi:malonyl-CoA/methylmalonyl-CoA synthetase
LHRCCDGSHGWLLVMTAFEDPATWVERAARIYPERLFLRTEAGQQYDYRSLRAASGRFAAALARQGVVAGDRVAVQVDKSAEAVLLYIACLRAGAVFVPINVSNTANEVDYFLRDSQPRLAVFRPEDAAVLEPLALRAGLVHVETMGADGAGSFRTLALQSDADPQLPQFGDANALAAIVYTSGTTGRSKGAMLTRANLASNADALAAAWRFTSRDVLLHTLPLFHIHGLFTAINTVLASGAAILLLPRFDATLVLKHLQESTVFMGVPTHFTRLLQHAGLNRESTANMRLFVAGSAPLLAETHHEFLRRTGHEIIERYGMTETLINTSNPYDGARVAGSVGLPLPGIALRTSNAAAQGGDQAEDCVGTLEVKGPNVFAGYWRDPEKTRAEFTVDGWFKTGDLGQIDAAGYVYIVGRAKDVVITGGYNVYPKEVEMELDALPGILESAVFGVAHPDFGEAVTAAVVCKPDAIVSEAEIIGAVQVRLARYKIPKRVIVVDVLPRNTMGKVQKNSLRATYAALYRDI